MKRLLCVFAAGLLLCCLLGGCVTTVEKGHLAVTVMGIGAADCILLQTADAAVLIDCGTEDDVATISAALRGAGITSLDTLIVTHFDKDHVGGAADLMQSFRVKKVIQSPYDGETNAEYRVYCAQLSQIGEVLTPTEVLTFSLDGVDYTVYPPRETVYGKNTENDVSLVVRAVHGDNVFLFAGDVEADRLQEMMANGTDWHADYLKVPHHGRYNKRSAFFLGEVEPAYAVITCSEKEPAEDRVLAVLEQLGAQIFEAKNKNVVARSDGKTLTVTQ